MAPSAFITTSTTSAANQVTAHFSQQPTVTGIAALPAGYAIIPVTPGAKAVTVTGVSIGATSIALATTSQTGGATYLLSLPMTGIVSTLLQSLNGPFENYFTGVATPISILLTRSLDNRTIEIIFTVPPVESQALNKNNYSINLGLSVTHVVKSSDYVYELSTSRQTEATVYTVTISGIEAA